MIYVALIVLCGLAINAKSGVDRLIYGTLAAATAAFFHFRGVPEAASQLLPF